ncbi:restriction endonuclease subunit R [Tenacibaculum todarodis]|uniref:Restriction endonuclease subunit R n=1 Tax=Tenacibaculum todarodis TaxID=1850252 RepID=A0A1L3JLY4_9FLAO|nr:DEAD/DEAH box helicase [Tenacibaculum todarodis]APG66103.1 restriction endonuclease subunit R [Tenacibaculum todarodis]
MNQGIYEELITQLVSEKLNELDKDKFFLKKTSIDKEEASNVLSKHLAKTLKHAFQLIKGKAELQIEIANKIIKLLKDELNKQEFNDDLVSIEGEILKAVFSKTDAHFSNLDLRLKEITPYTRLTQSELFTGGNGGLSLESELKKEILSSNEIYLLVSFIKFKGIIILEKELREYTERGGKLKVITTTYIGATDYKAIQLLSNLPNTEVKISYNTSNERLHAKAYLFYRNTGFHTAYIGSSNFSRSALTDGLEWNLKVTTKEVSHIIDKFNKTFDSYWKSDDFELFDDSKHKEKLQNALKQSKFSKPYENATALFDIKPFPYQKEVLEKLEVERTVHNRFRNLVVAATGTGKTVISAFDYKRFKQNNKSAKLLFLAHRKEIIQKSLSTFQGVLRNNNIGELWVDGMVPDNFEFVFASVQSVKNKFEQYNLTPDYYDYIIIDECHHQTANSYREIINYFKPKILLGLTATPERMDGGDILEDFDNKIAAEIRLPEAMNRKLLCPFQYFGITDSIDLTNVSWARGKYVASELTSLYTENDRRVREIIDALDKYTKDINEVRSLGYCVSMEHAKFMAKKFTLAGLKADYLTSINSTDRIQIRQKLEKKEINYLFVVDMFNEGIDIPEIDTVLFLRPTESLTVFLQQLGRGLRLHEDKDCLTVLDFVGNSKPEYNFESKFRALIGKTNTTVKKEIEDDFPHLPLGCSIILEKKSKETILKNISAATSLNKNKLIQRIQQFQNDTNLPLTLSNFIEFYNIPVQSIYKRGSWKRLCQLAGKIENFNSENEKSIVSAILNKWLSTNSLSYFSFILKIAKQNFKVTISDLNENEKAMLLMLHYDVWQKEGDFDSLEKSIHHIGVNPVLIEEIKEILEFLIDKTDFKELPIQLPYEQPLKLHSRYTRDQILAAFKFSSFEKKSSNREGTALNKNLNTEILFINLIKSEENFSPTTMYDDYAVNELLFHWQTQNSARPDIGKGLSYIKHQEENKRILLFVREKAKDEFGNTKGYVFIGEGNIKDYYGSKPMSINWELNEPMPNYLWKDAAKLSVG